MQHGCPLPLFPWVFYVNLCYYIAILCVCAHHSGACRNRSPPNRTPIESSPLRDVPKPLGNRLKMPKKIRRRKNMRAIALIFRQTIAATHAWRVNSRIGLPFRFSVRCAFYFLLITRLRGEAYVVGWSESVLFHGIVCRFGAACWDSG